MLPSHTNNQSPKLSSHDTSNCYLKVQKLWTCTYSKQQLSPVSY